MLNLSERAKVFSEKFYGTSCAFRPGWYRRSGVSPIEELAFGGLFNQEGSIFTRSFYVDLRDGIINLLSVKKKQGVSLLECCESLGGPPNILLRVCSFLHHWGIISTESDSLFPCLTNVRALGCLGVDFLEPIHLPEDLAEFLPQPPISEETTNPIDPSLCSVCEEGCGTLTFHCQGRYDKAFSSQDFEQCLSLPDTWSNTEIGVLCESVEQHGEDWVEVANCVTSRSKEECFLKFLDVELPEEDAKCKEVFQYEVEASLPGSLMQTALALRTNIRESVAFFGAKVAATFFQDRIQEGFLDGVFTDETDVFEKLNRIERVVDNEISLCGSPEQRFSLFSLKSGAYSAFLSASSKKAEVCRPPFNQKKKVYSLTF